MRSGRGIAAAALCSVSLAHGVARAQDARLQAVFSGSVGFTDNVNATAEPADDTAAGPQADGFAMASPGLVFNYLTPRTSHTLSYTFTGNLSFRTPEANSMTHAASWSSRLAVTPTTSVLVGANGTYGQTNTVQLVQSTTQGTPQTEQIGTTKYLQGTINEGVSKQLSPVLSFGQAASFAVYNPLPEEQDPADSQTEQRFSRSYTATNTLSLQRLFQHDTGALALTVAYTHFQDFDADDNDLGARDELVNTLVASWTHEYGHRLSSQLDLGVTQALDLDSGDQVVQPAGLAAIRYTHERGEAELAYAHAAGVNVYAGDTQFTDQLTLRLAAPVVHAWHLTAEGSAGVQLAAGASTYPENLSTALLTDAALIWAPIIPVPNFSLSLRYQHTRQRTPPGADAATDAETAVVIRNTVLLAVSGAFPETVETGSRILMTQPFGSAGPDGQRRRQTTPTPSTESESESAPGPSGGGAAE